ncbi:methyltransferase [Aureococcus anophagefferens]|nr:methyltransferase [Aureococcus anophagefferens]
MRWLALACACVVASDEVVISYEGSIDANLGGLGNRLLGLISAKMFADLARARFAVVDERFTGLARFSELFEYPPALRWNASHDDHDPTCKLMFENHKCGQTLAHLNSRRSGHEKLMAKLHPESSTLRLRFPQCDVFRVVSNMYFGALYRPNATRPSFGDVVASIARPSAAIAARVRNATKGWEPANHAVAVHLRSFFKPDLGAVAGCLCDVAARTSYAATRQQRDPPPAVKQAWLISDSGCRSSSGYAGGARPRRGAGERRDLAAGEDSRAHRRGPDIVDAAFDHALARTARVFLGTPGSSLPKYRKSGDSAMAEGRSARTRALNEELHQYARRKDYANVMATLARGERDKTVDGRTFAIAISACADAGDAAGAVRLLRAAADRGGKCAPEVAACTACVKALCGDDLPGARELLRAMARAPAATPRFGALAEAARPNARTANTFLRGCLRHGDGRAADCSSARPLASASATLAALAKVVVCDHLEDPAATVDALKRAFGLEEVAYRAAREALGAGARGRKRRKRRRDALAAVEARRAGALDVRALVAPGAATAHVELGCGDGEWAAARACASPDEAWLCCEWRHDRAAAVVGRAALSGLANLGVARGAALRSAGAVDGDFDGRHMLDGPCLHAVAKALRPGGALTVVTDNEWYAALRGRRAAVGGWATPALTSAPGERYVRHYARGAVAVYAGAPGPAVGHGAHASAGDRYVLHLVRNGDAPREPEARAAPAAAAPPEKRKRRVPTGGKYGKKKKKKKAAV